MQTTQSATLSISKLIDADELHNILTVSEVRTKLDIGSCFVYKLLHPSMGVIVAVASSGEKSAVVSFV